MKIVTPLLTILTVSTILTPMARDLRKVRPRKGESMQTFQYATVRGLKMFYREAGSKDLPTIVLLHGFPSSSHMFRDLIPQLAEKFHVIAPDYIGFGYSDAPAADSFESPFDYLAAHVEELLFGVLGLKKFSIYVQ